MTIEQITNWLAVSLCINYAILLVWWLAFWLAGDWMHRLHGRWFALSRPTFNAIHYAAMAYFKLTVLVFNATPLFALWLTT